MHGLNPEHMQGELQNYLPYIMEFVELTTDKKKHPKLSYMKDSMMLLADIAHLFPSEKQRICGKSFLQDRINTMIKFNTDGELTQGIYFVKQELQLHM